MSGITPELRTNAKHGLSFTADPPACAKMRVMEQGALRAGWTIEVRSADSEPLVREARELFKEYASSLGFDLGFQDFARELEELPGAYVAPAGALLLAFCDGNLAGCVAMRPLEAGACEMKRLYVRPRFRGKGVGRQLAEAVVAAARDAGHAAMRLDTIPWMRDAVALYRSLGFVPIAPYRHNPIAGAQFFELRLAAADPPVAL